MQLVLQPCLLLFCAFTTALPANVYSISPQTYSTLQFERQILRKISQYALSIDSKNYPSLSDIFTHDLVAQYPYPPPNDTIHGATALQQVLEFRLFGLVTQHAISTTVVDFSGISTANSTAYLTATYLGQSTLAGEALMYYGKYEDEWVCDEAGQWRCRKRIVTPFVSSGGEDFLFCCTRNQRYPVNHGH